MNISPFSTPTHKLVISNENLFVLTAIIAHIDKNGMRLLPQANETYIVCYIHTIKWIKNEKATIERYRRHTYIQIHTQTHTE